MELFYLTTLGLVRFLTKDSPTLKNDEQDKQVINVVDASKTLTTSIKLRHELSDRFIV